MTGLGVALVLAGIIILLAGLGQIAQNKAFTNAELVQGTIIDKRKRDIKNRTAYELTINYAVNGIEYCKVIGIKLSEYKKISEGDNFSLKYRPDKPFKAVNPTELNPQKAHNILIFGIIMVILGIVILAAGMLF